MANLYFLVYDNKSTGQTIQASDHEIIITGNHLRIMKTEFLQDEDIQQINEYSKKQSMTSKRQKFQVKTAWYSFLDSAQYVSIIAYLIVFTLSSFIENLNSLGFVFACFSIGSSIIDTNFAEIHYKRKQNYLFVTFFISIFSTIIINLIFPNLIESSFGNIVECVILLLTFLKKFIKSFKENYQKNYNINKN